MAKATPASRQRAARLVGGDKGNEKLKERGITKFEDGSILRPGERPRFKLRRLRPPPRRYFGSPPGGSEYGKSTRFPGST